MKRATKAALMGVAMMTTPFLLQTKVEARTHHHHYRSHHYRHYTHHKHHQYTYTYHRLASRIYNQGTVVAHPAGCPWHLFCGCGVSVRAFGHPVRDLFLASNYRKFPPAAPGPGMIAWRPGHAFYIEQYYGDGTALAYDPNNGGHQTRIHRRSLTGFRVVNPHGGRYAMM